MNKLLTTFNLNKANRGISDIRYIVIHYVGALGGAEDNCRYYAGQKVGASAHYYCGFSGEVWQSVEDKDIAWHCGASTYLHQHCRNANSIGIELCVRKRNTGSLGAEDKDWYFEQATVDAAIQLTKSLMEKYNIPVANIIRHYDVTGKCCPNPYVMDTGAWQKFKAALTGQSSAAPIQPHNADKTEIETSTPVSTAVGWVKRLQQKLNRQGFGLAEDGIPGSLTLAACPVIRRGARGGITRLVQERFGFTPPDNDGIFGRATDAHTRLYQSACGLDADGIIGRDTWYALLNQ